MIKYATIGTSWITEEFILGTLPLPDIKLCGVYSRNIENARKFASPYGSDILVWDDIQALLKSEIDVVYIASPNSLHYEQSKLCLQSKKHVICEKSITVTPKQLKELQKLAEKNGVIYMEAIMTMHQPQRKILLNALGEIGKISSVRLDFAKTSSKYNDFISGKNPNIFNPKFATGCLMDMGVYCVYGAVALFGVPLDTQTYFGRLNSGIDGFLTSIFIYRDKQVVLTSSKVSMGGIGSEIGGEWGSIIIDNISQLTGMRILFKDGTTKEIFGDMPKSELMGNQAKSFCNYINNYEEYRKEYLYFNKTALNVSTLMEKMRYQGGLRFSEDTK